MPQPIASPHHLPPLVVTADTTRPWATVGVAELLAEPPTASPHWLAGSFARALAAGCGLFGHALGEEGPLVARLRHAGVIDIAADADPEELRRDSPGWAVAAELGVGVGSCAPALVIVGERANPRVPWPWYSRGGSWLLRALRWLGHDELTVYLTNALDPQGRRCTDQLAQLAQAFAPSAPTWVGLGSTAKRVLRASCVPHLLAKHPSWHARFATAEGPEGYADLLAAAGVPPGRWRARPIAGAEVVTRPALADRFDLPLDVAFRRAPVEDSTTPPRGAGVPPRKKNGAGRVGKKKCARARNAFVTGQVPSVRQASVLVECSYTDLCAASREEDWKADKERHDSMVRQKALEKSAELEAKALSTARTTAWGAAVKAVQKVYMRIESDEYQPSAMDAARLVSMAIELSNASDIGAEYEREKMASKSITQIGRDLVLILKKQYGEDVIDVDAVVSSTSDTGGEA